MTINALVRTVFLSLVIVSSCKKEDVETGVLYESDFRQGQDGWKADYTDYGTQTADLRFESAWTGLPQPLNTTRKSIRISSMNRSDDVFMYLKKKLTNLPPNTTYKLTFEIELASQYATNSVGIGGSPGSSVYLKAGATPNEPMKLLKNGFYSISIDKGNQASGGSDAVVLGNVGAGDDITDYTLITRSNASPFLAQTNAQGELWLIVGTDSGFEGLTTLYYSRIWVTAR